MFPQTFSIFNNITVTWSTLFKKKKEIWRLIHGIKIIIAVAGVLWIVGEAD